MIKRIRKRYIEIKTLHRVVRRKTLTSTILLLLVLTCVQMTRSQNLEFGQELEAEPFAIEGEKFRVFVGCCGKGISNVDVYIEGGEIISLHAITNESGYANFDIPEVNISVPCKLRAEKEGYESVETNITIVNLPKLYVVCPEVVEEGKRVKLRVVDEDMNGIPNAILSINNEDVFTDENGTYVFEVPQVGFPMPVILSARKDGYEVSDETKMWIADNKSSSLKAPTHVQEGEYFDITYGGEGKVKIYFNGSFFDSNGITVKAPHVEETKSFQINVYDENLSLIDYRFVIVVDNRKRGLIVSPSIISENSLFNISLFSLCDGKPLSGVKILFDGKTNSTDSLGNASFTAPYAWDDYELNEIRCCDDNISCAKKYIWIKKTRKYSLIIDGPSMAMSGENVSFSVTDVNGRSLFSVVIFNNQSYLAWNGSVRVQIPLLNKSKYMCIKAKSPGYSEAEKIIYVIGRENKLQLDCSDSVEEGEDFLVKVEDEGGNPVKGARVWFNFRKYVCDEHGEVTLTAPDVLISKKFLVYAEKEKYLPASKWLTVVSVGIGKKFLKIVSPLALPPMEKFQVKVVDEKGNGIGGVSIKMQYGNLVKYFGTGENGSVSLTSPPMMGDDAFTITATKDGYVTDIAVIHLYEISPTLPDLKVSVSQTMVEEGREFIVRIEDENGEPVEGALLYIDGRMCRDVSDKNGIVICRAPYVEMKRSCFVHALKEGYNFGYTWIEVTNRAEVEEPLNIKTNDTVYEGERFTVKVEDLSGNPVSGVVVWFGPLKEKTDNDGTVSFTAPSVKEDGYVLLGISSSGYSPCYKLIKVIDRYKEVALEICVPPKVMEKEDIDIVVRDVYGYLIDNATIIIDGEIAGYTDENGKLRIKLPEVDHDTTVDILAVKPGYVSAHEELMIKNRGRSFFEENWFLIPAIILIFLIAVFAYFYYRQYII